MDPDSRRCPGDPRDAGPGLLEVIPDVIIEDVRWRRMVPRVEALVRRAAALAGGAGSVLLTDDRSVRRLNRRYRGRDKPTNVLTFEAAGGGGRSGGGGDIALASGVVRREAAAAGKRVSDHLVHLVVHGALHLRGADHHSVGEARRMEMMEGRLLRRLGVANPWRGW